MSSVTPEVAVASGRPWLAWSIVAAFAAAWLLPLSRTWQLAPDLGHAWVVPFLMAYLWWERWDERPPAVVGHTTRIRWWLWAAVLVAVHASLRLFLTPFPVWPAALALFTGTVVLTALTAAWLLGGRAGLRWLGGPLILVVSVLPMPTVFDLKVIGPLREAMATLAAEACNLLGRPAMASGTSVRLANGWVGIDEACGGIRSLQACVMIALFFGEWYRFSGLRRFALVLVGCAAALAGNGSRVIFLSLRARDGAAAVAASHDLAGWLAMGTSVLLTGWLAWRWAGSRLPEQRRMPRPASAGASAALRWAAVVGTCFLVSESAVRLWFARGERVRRDVPQWVARLPTERATFRREPLPEPARELLGPDTFVAGTWPLGRDVYAFAYYIEWHEGQKARTVPFLHNPTVCLPFAGCELMETLPSLPVAWSHGEIPFFAYRFRRLGEQTLVAFTIWDPSRGQLLAASDIASWRTWFSRQWTEVRAARKDQPAQLFAVSIPWDEEAPARMQQLLSSLIQPADAR